MAGRNPQQALRNFTEPIQRALSCLTRVYIQTSGFDPEKKHALALGTGNPIATTTDRGEVLGVSVLQNYRVVETDDTARGPWKVRTTKYIYTLHDESGQEIVAYHWHPDVPPGYPHLHVKATGATT